MSDANTPPAVNIAALIDDGDWAGYQKLIVALAALAFIVDGLANHVLGLAIPALIADWGEQRDAFAKVAALSMAGVGIGAVCGGALGDRFGRRFGLILSIAVFGAATLVATLAVNTHQLMWIRFIDGLALGAAIPNGAALVSEFTPAKRRPIAIALGMVFIPVGGFLSGVLGSFVLPVLGWKGLFLIAGALSMGVSALLFAALPESPRFLSRCKDRRKELLTVLRRCKYEIADDAELIDEEATTASASVKELFGAGIRRDTLALWIAFFFCLLGAYAVFSWVPTMLSERGFNLAQTSAGMTAYNLGGCIGGVFSGWIIISIGTRNISYIIGVGGVLSALLLAILPLDPRAGLLVPAIALVVMGVFSAGLHNLVYTLAATIYPPTVKATGVGAAAGLGRLGAVASSFAGTIALTAGGSTGYFVLIAVSTMISVTAAAFVSRQIPPNREPGGTPLFAKTPALERN
ncbi:MFS transporter [Hyphococcus luteus]|nr:MFS transporter [Marinicaulis flavus]